VFFGFFCFCFLFIDNFLKEFSKKCWVTALVRSMTFIGGLNQFKLKWRQKWKTDVSAVLLDSNYLLCMKTKINILHQKHVLASIKSIKILQPCCTLLMTNVVSFNNLTSRFTTLYQANWAENYWKKDRIWYA